MALVCWRTLAENPWMEVPMSAVAQHLPPRPKDPERTRNVRLRRSGARHRGSDRCRLAAAAFEKLDLDLDIAAGQGLEEAVVQSTQIGAVNSWLRNQPAEIVSAAVVSLRKALAPYADGPSVRLPAAMWLISSTPA